MLACCFRSARVSKTDEGDRPGIATDTLQTICPVDIEKETSKNENQVISNGDSSKPDGQVFQFSELAAATMNFEDDHCLGVGGFGKVYKGRMESTNQIVVIKKLHRTNALGHNEFLLEALVMSLLHHPNVINHIGYCTFRNERLLVFECMPLGSLEDHLHKLDPDRKVLDWNTRMRIAAGAVKGLEYLHDQLSPSVIHCDMKTSNILLDERYHPKLCDFGMAKLGPTGDDTHVYTRVMGTSGYYAPEYVKMGRLSTKSDTYCFAVVLLELITGRRAVDTKTLQDLRMSTILLYGH